MTMTDNYPPVPPRRFFTIGQAAELACSKPHILRYWEKEVSPLSKVIRRNGRRYYSREQVLMLRKISRMLERGMTLSGVESRLREEKKAPVTGDGETSWVRRELEDILSIL